MYFWDNLEKRAIAYNASLHTLVQNSNIRQHLGYNLVHYIWNQLYYNYQNVPNMVYQHQQVCNYW